MKVLARFAQSLGSDRVPWSSWWFGQRFSRGWSQEDLAEHTGLHRTYIGSLERGERNVSLINITLLAATLLVPAAQLVSGIGTE